MSQINEHTIIKRSVHGVMALASRTAILQLIAFFATFLLTIVLKPEIFGVYYIVTAVKNFLNYFSDIGLAAALVQKKEELTIKDLQTTFTIQETLVGIISVATFLLSGHIGSYFTLNSPGIFLLQMLVISFFLSSLKTIPSILLERELQFNKLIIPQIIESISFYCIAVILAFLGWGIAAFSVAVIVSSVSGLIAIYFISPWKVGFSFDKTVAKKLIFFGLPFQLNSFLALIKDDLFTLYLGKVLPFSAVGYIGWAKKWSEAPLRLIMDNIIRVTFPAFSRLQHDNELLRKTVTKSLLYIAVFSFPMAIFLMISVPGLILVIPKYSKWEPALLPFYLFTISAVLSTITSPLINVLNGIGKVKITLLFMVLWTAMTWAIIPVSIQYFGMTGVALGMLMISMTFGIVLVVVKRFVNFSVKQAFLKPIISIMPLAIFLMCIAVVPIPPQTKLLAQLLGGLGIWLATFYIIMYNEFRKLLYSLHV